VIIAVLLLGLQWPAVQPIKRTAEFDDASRAQFSMQIRDTEGASVYLLECYGDKAFPESSFLYDGEFECRLTSEGKNPDSEYSTLLTEVRKQERDWQSRARFFGSELTDSCGNIPDFGKRRHFLLRGFRLDLDLSDVKLTEDKKLSSFVLTVAVGPDPHASRSIAQAPIIDKKWAQLPCKLDNSVKPHFK